MAKKRTVSCGQTREILSGNIGEVMTQALNASVLGFSIFLTLSSVSDWRIFSFRELRRIIYVPFSGMSIRGTTADVIQAHIRFKNSLESGELSSAIGMVVRLGKCFASSGITEITATYLPWVTKHLHGTIPDVLMSYAIALWFCMAVSHSEVHSLFKY